MSRKGCDYSTARPPLDELINAGVTFVFRYYSNPPDNKKNLTRN